MDSATLGAHARRVVRGLSWETIARRHLAAYGLGPKLTVVLGTGGARPASVSRGRAARAEKDTAWT